MHSKKHRLFFHVGFALIGLALPYFGHAAEQTQTDHTRGKLLYSLHCIACHNEQVHWLANKKASDWPSLIAQVKLWQNISNLKWREKDVDNVARYLNSVYYHYPTPNTVAGKK